MFVDDLATDKRLQPYMLIRSRKGGEGIMRFGRVFGDKKFNKIKEDILELMKNYTNEEYEEKYSPHYKGNYRFYKYIGSIPEEKAFLSDEWVTIGKTILSKSLVALWSRWFKLHGVY